jgi:hypothetical protein
MDNRPPERRQGHMLSLRDLWKALFPRVPPSLAEEQVRAIDAARRMIGVQAEGNIALQSGRYLTARDMERQREQLAKREF